MAGETLLSIQFRESGRVAVFQNNSVQIPPGIAVENSITISEGKPSLPMDRWRLIAGWYDSTIRREAEVAAGIGLTDFLSILSYVNEKL